MNDIDDKRAELGRLALDWTQKAEDVACHYSYAREGVL